MKNYLILFVFFVLLSSCSPLSRKQIIKFESKKEYKVFHNNQPIETKYFFWDSSNIKEITKNKKTKKINIIPISTNSEMISGTQLFEENNNFKKTRHIGDITMIVVDGLPFDKEEFEKIKIEKSSISKEVTVLKGVIAVALDYSESVLVVNTNRHYKEVGIK